MATLFLVILILVPSVGFGSWPTVSRYAQASPAWTNLLLMTITALAMILYFGKTAVQEGVPPGRTIWLMVVAALLNSVALILFGILIQRYPSFVPIAQALMPMVSLIGNVWLLGAPYSTGQVLFGLGACACIAGMGYCTPR